MRKWIFAVLVGGMIVGSATMAFADEEAPVRGREFGEGKPGIQQMKKDGRKPGRRENRLGNLFETYLQGEQDTFEALVDEGEDLREDMKDWRESMKEEYEDEFDAIKEEGKALMQEWKEKIDVGEATRENAKEAMRVFRQEAHDEILGVDDSTREALDEIHDQLAVEREAGKEIREDLREAVEAEDANTIEFLLRTILGEMETRLDLHEQRVEIFRSI